MTDARRPLTRVTEDYLKAIWSAEEWGGAPISAREIAERFGITPATVSATLKRLVGQGFVTHRAYGPIALTDEGRRLALAVVRRHRLLETFLVEMLGYDWAEVHEEAEELEHTASDLLIERIARALGDPVVDPHGDPIPSADGEVRRPEPWARLDRSGPGGYRVLRVSDAEPTALARLGSYGVRPGTALEVTGRSDEDVVITLGRGVVEVPLGDAAAVLLEPASGSS